MRYKNYKNSARAQAAAILAAATALLLPTYASGQTDTCLSISQLRAVWTWHQELQAADKLTQAQGKLIYSLTIQDRLKDQQINSLKKQTEILQMQRGFQQQIAINSEEEKKYYKNLAEKKTRESQTLLGIAAIVAIILVIR